MNFIGTGQNDNIQLTAPSTPDYVDLMEGYDTLHLSNPPSGQKNTVYVQGTEEIRGGIGDDTIVLQDDTLVMISGGGGTDYVENASGAPVYMSLTDINVVYGGGESENVQFTIKNIGLNEPYGLYLSDGIDSARIVNDVFGTTLSMGVMSVESISVSGQVEMFMQDRQYGTRIDADPESLVTIRLAQPNVGLKTANLLEVSGGNMVVYGTDGRDVIRDFGGDTGNYTLGAGSDRVELLGSVDHYTFVSAVEAVVGGSGSDTLLVEGDIPDRMSIDLGGGIDMLDLSNASGGRVLVSNVEQIFGGEFDDAVTIRTTLKNGYLDLGDGYDTLYLNGANNSVDVRHVEAIYGSSSVDRITVSSKDTTDTRLYGYQGGDVLTGGAGDDYIVGGAGKDLMRGGEGADKFVFQRISDSDLDTRDIIYDFQVGLDKLVFTGMLKGEASLVVEDAFTGFKGLGNTEVHFVDGTDQLLMDLDGNGTMDMRMALIGVGNTLGLGDFIWEAPPPP